MEESSEQIKFEFFKGIVANQRIYYCDFHRIFLKTERLFFRVSLQSTDIDMVVDIATTEDGVWKLVESDTSIEAELEFKLITAILNHLAQG
jgi:hypothetical protein